jgi:integrase
MSYKAAMTSFTQDELFRLMKHMRAVDPEMHAICLLALWHGMRITEVLTLTTENIIDGRIVFGRLKGSLSANQTLKTHDAPEYDELEALRRLGLKPDGRALFSERLTNNYGRQVNRLLVRFCDAVGIHRTKAHMHSFKHTAVRLLRDAGMEIEDVSNIVGHADPKNTLRYSVKSTEQLEDELDKLRVELRAQQPKAMGAAVGGD